MKTRTTKEIFAWAHRLIEAARKDAERRRGWELRSHLEDINLYSEYAEPGYTDPASGVIATANWNKINKYNPETKERELISDVMVRLCDLFEKLGIEIEWSDEWSSCEGCNKLVRTSPDSYGWKASYWFSDGCGLYCRECVESDPAGYLEELEGSDRKCMSLEIPLEEHGYKKLDPQFENGWHAGQDDDPKKIAKTLRDAGITRFIFTLDEPSQFYIRFGLWVHEEQIAKLEATGFKLKEEQKARS